MGEVRDEHPSRRVTDAREEGHGEHESPTLTGYLIEYVRVT